MNSPVQHSLITMRIGLVADDFVIRSGTGIARYAAELLKGMAGIGYDVVPISVPQFRIPGGSILAHTLQLPWEVARVGWRTDLIHATSPITAIPFPLLRQVKLITFHDISSLLYRNSGTSLHARIALPAIFKTVACASNGIIAVSSQTRDEIVTHLGVDPNRITVIPLGVSDEFKPQPCAEQPFPVVGYVGHMKARKRLDLLLQAFHLLVRRYPEINARLAIHGTRDSEYQHLIRLVNELGIQGQTIFPGFADDPGLPDIYRSFNCFVMPSEWEGFGLPILEAQRCGIPVIIRKGARIPQEVSRYCVKAASVEDMAEQMACLLMNPELAQKIAGEALAYSNQFTWERTVSETISVYHEFLS